MNTENEHELAHKLRELLAEVARRRQRGAVSGDSSLLEEYLRLVDHLGAELMAWQDSADQPANRPGSTLQPVSTHVLNDTIDHVPGSGSLPAQSAIKWEEELLPEGEKDRFRKLKPFAAGGVGEVWLALDMQLQREVALKELQDRHQDEQTKRNRFLVEAHITGVLEHPGVIPVYALGMDDARRPFYAMRFVRGESLKAAINEFHDKQPPRSKFQRSNLDLRGLLRRFADVCVTVAYAHSRGVLHRDLKPANIMLGKYGETYIVDWGMARIVGSRAEENSMVSEDVVRPAVLNSDSATEYGSILGTPGFMSPEQAEGRLEHLGPTTDIYSLGAILYYLLTNRASITSSSFSEFFDKVTRSDFPPPLEIDATIPKPLSAICLRAMAVNPADRYQSARDLARDIERWLADEPTTAGTESLHERAGRYVRRNYRWLAPLGAASLIVAITSLVAAVSIDQLRKRAEASALAERAAKQRAEANFVKARETVDTWLTGYNEALGSMPIPGVQAVRTRMLELAAKEYESFVAEHADDSALRLEQARTLVRLGSIYRLLGRPEEAQQKYHSSIESLQELSGKAQSAELSSTLALTQGMLALVQAELGDFARGEETFEAAISSLAAADSGEPQSLSSLSTLWTNRGGLLAKAGRFAEADNAFQKALEYGDKFVRSSSNDMGARLIAATAQLGAGQVKLVQGDARGASLILERAAKFAGGVVDIDDQSVRNLQLKITANSHLAAARRRLGDAPGEQQAYQEAIAAASSLVKLQPEVPAFRANLAMMRTDLAQAYLEQFRAPAAIGLLQESVDSLSELSRAFPTVAEYREALSAARANFAQAEQSLGHFDAALKHLDAASVDLEGLRRAFPDVAPYQLRSAILESNAGQVLFLKNRQADAIKRFENATELFESLRKSDLPLVEMGQAEAITCQRYGEILWEDDPASASKQFSRSRQVWEEIQSSSDDPELHAGAACFFALCSDTKLRDLRLATRLAEPLVRESPDNIRYRLILAAVQALGGRWDDLQATIDQVAAFDSNLAPAFDFLLALRTFSEGERDDAQATWQRGSDWLGTNLPGEWAILAIKNETARVLAAPSEDAEH